MRAVFIILVFFLASFSGCFGEGAVEKPAPSLSVEEVLSATRGQYMTIEVDSNTDWTANRSAGLFFMDSFGVLRDAEQMTFPADQKALQFLVMDSERDDVQLTITAGEEVWSANLTLEDSTELMLVDGRRAYDTIDMLTTSHIIRCFASASIQEGGAN